MRWLSMRRRSLRRLRLWLARLRWLWLRRLWLLLVVGTLSNLLKATPHSILANESPSQR
jgi:hypothetical protein